MSYLSERKKGTVIRERDFQEVASSSMCLGTINVIPLKMKNVERDLLLFVGRFLLLHYTSFTGT
jgi:hypothetical protein